MPTDLELARPALAMARRRRHTRRLTYTATALATVAAVTAGTIAVRDAHGPTPRPHRTGVAAPQLTHSTIPPVTAKASLVITRDDGLYARDAAGHDHRIGLPGVDPVHLGAQVSLSRDGTRVAVTWLNLAKVLVVDLATGQVSGYPQSKNVNGVAWSPDGRKLLLASDAWSASSVLTLASGQTRDFEVKASAGIGHVFWLPDSSGLLIDRSPAKGSPANGSPPPSVPRADWMYVDLTGRIVRTLPAIDGYGAGFGLSPDGRSFLALGGHVSGVGTVHVVNPETGAVSADLTWAELGGTASGPYGGEPLPIGWIGPHEIGAFLDGGFYKLFGYDVVTHTTRTVVDLPGVRGAALPGL
jgi:hypothetical protein